MPRLQITRSTQYRPPGAGAVLRPWNDKLSDIIDARDFGLKAGGATDYTGEINAALTEASVAGGAIVVLPPYDVVAEGITPVDGVSLVGSMRSSGYTGLHAATRLVAAGAGGNIIDQSVGTVQSFSVEGITFYGPGAAIDGMGLSGLNMPALSVRYCQFQNFKGSGLKLTAGTASTFIDLILGSCCLGAAGFADFTGALHILASDTYLDRIQASAQRVGAVSSANLYAVAAYLGGVGHFVGNCVAEFGDIGWYLACAGARFAGTRADHNAGHGWFLSATASLNALSACHAYDNSQDTSNTYDGFNFANGAGHFGNKLDGCIAYSVGVANVHRYGFNAPNADSYGNYRKDSLINCNSYGHGTGPGFNTPLGGVTIQFPDGAWQPIGAGTATPDVTQQTAFTAGSNADTYTNFVNGVEGQTIKLLAAVGASAATIQHNANIVTKSGADIVMQVGLVYSFKNRNGVWYQLGS